jgi:hypothetical protein
MAHVDDLYEPGDDREPDEPEREFLGLEELIEAIDDPQALATVEALVADVRYLRGLETREEWAVTARSDVVPSKWSPLLFKSAESAGRAVQVSGGVVWRRTLTVHSWEPIANEPPF